MPGSETVDNVDNSAVVTPWEPEPVPAEKFHRPGEWANINRAPYDRVGGVIFKRAALIARVRYAPADPAPEQPEPWQGQGTAIVRWLFSEQPGTEEQLLAGVTLEFLHDTTLEPGAQTGMRAHGDVDELFYVVAGQGRLYHRPATGSPIMARPLRSGDAVLVRGGEYHCVAAEGELPLRLIVVGLRRP